MGCCAVLRGRSIRLSVASSAPLSTVSTALGITAQPQMLLMRRHSPGWVQSIVMIMSVCLSVCPHISSFTEFLCMFPLPVARSSSDGVAICCALPVLPMTSCFYIVEPKGRIKHDVMFRRVPVGRQTTAVFG